MKGIPHARREEKKLPNCPPPSLPFNERDKTNSEMQKLFSSFLDNKTTRFNSSPSNAKMNKTRDEEYRFLDRGGEKELPYRDKIPHSR